MILSQGNGELVIVMVIMRFTGDYYFLIFFFVVWICGVEYEYEMK